MALPIWHPPPVDLDNLEKRERASTAGAPSGLSIGIQPERSGLADAPWAHLATIPEDDYYSVRRDANAEDGRRKCKVCNISPPASLTL